MSAHTFNPFSTRTSDGATATAHRNRLLAAGVLAGPLFGGVSAAQGFLRDGFDLGKHPISLLANGDYGWVQTANFVVTGLLVLASAAGVRRTITTGRGSRWLPRLVATFGVGLVVSGVFVADPESGFPPGTPAGPPAVISWQSIVHGTGAAVAFNALTVAMVVLAVRYAGQGRRGWALTNILPVLAIVGLSAQPTQDGASIRIALSALVAFGWLAALARTLRKNRR